MSQFEFLKVKDVRTNFSDQKPVYGLSAGSQSITRQIYNASGYSNSNVEFECNPPGFNAVLDRAILFTFEVLLDFTGADQGSPLLKIGTTDGLRAFPILSCCTGVTAKVNNQQISVQPQEWISRLTQYMNTDERQMSLSPCMLDQFQRYQDYVSEGASRNPLGKLFAEV